eukprot:TRINITY_DN1848_c0_g3_i4.p1 TRINITY_DN1848_c0_g3~~TRINITY_DN1848_c0_g3_i4.p1  ORF type:complete len:316 (+),score=81.32 TRINITY_DN1848_c0_g3_i4:1315-2262(+)
MYEISLNKLLKKKQRDYKLPVGRPFEDTKFMIRNSEDVVLEDKIFQNSDRQLFTGRLLIGSSIRRCLLDDEKFETIRESSVPWWRETGDLVQVTGKKIYYLGRIDNFVKVFGKKVNPQEVEEALMAHPQVISAVVLKANSNLVALIVLEGMITNKATLPTTTESISTLPVTLFQDGAKATFGPIPIGSVNTPPAFTTVSASTGASTTAAPTSVVSTHTNASASASAASAAFTTTSDSSATSATSTNASATSTASDSSAASTSAFTADVAATSATDVVVLEIYDHLKHLLPPNMRPHFILPVSHLPLTRNGKVCLR